CESGSAEDRLKLDARWDDLIFPSPLEGARQVRRTVKHYNLNMILAVGYRVRPPRGVQFRQWATERLREYFVKGFTLDDERLKGRDQLADYFDELLARIREIRASERRVYQRIREIFALAADYVEGPPDKKSVLFSPRASPSTADKAVSGRVVLPPTLAGRRVSPRGSAMYSYVCIS
ncbi:MAG: virulence RhuM family protein, partial [bacterium]|nr:virulence RhuM family protein [bacterium]